MNKILYCIYVGICSFHPSFSFIKANDLTVIAPLPADLIRPHSIRTFANWLDDVYLNSRARARNNPSRFTESEDYSPLPDPIYRPQHSASGSLQNGPVQRSTPSNVFPKCRTPIVMDSSRANRGGTTTLLLRPTLAIVIQFLFTCPPPHDPSFIAPPFKYLIALRHKKILQIFWGPSSYMDLYLPCKKDIHHTINTPDFDTKRSNTHTLNSPTKFNPSLPHHAIQSIQKTSKEAST